MYYNPITGRPERSIVKLVCGAPASGKSTYVNEHKEPNDFVLDLDLIRQAIGAPEKTSELFQIQVLAIRELLYNHITFNKIGAKNIWVIAGLPEANSREQVAKRLNAEIIFIDTPMKICIEHAEKDNSRLDKEKQIRIITEYFAKLS